MTALSLQTSSSLLGYTNPMTTLGEYEETLFLTVNCPCGLQVRGSGKFHCPNCKRVFETKVSFGESDISYDNLYRRFLTAASEDGLGYSKTALENMLAKVTEEMPDSNLWLVGPVQRKRQSWIGKFGYTDLVMAIVVVTSVILLHTFHYF